MQVIAHLKQMEEARFLTIYSALQEQGFGPLDGEVAKALKFRPHAIKKLPMAARARQARRILESGSNAELCYELFGRYLLQEHLELVADFLDQTGIEHQDGMIVDFDAARPAGDQVAQAVAQLDSKFAADDVNLYLSLCAQQWPEVSEIGAAWSSRQG
jgi:hypothetical protein